MGVNDEDQMVLDNIDEFIKDENKVVTYKWLSLSLSLNVNKAKSYLEQYYSQNNKDLKAIYFVSGVKQDGENNKLHCYQLVRKESLNDVKSEYSELISSHIYSLQKCQIKDASTLYLSDIDIIKETLERCNDFSPIQCEQAKTNKRSVLNNTKTSNGNGIHVEKKVIPSTATVASKPKDTQQKESPPLSFFNKTAGSKVVAEKKESKSNSEEKEKKQQKAGIANAFLKSKPKTEVNISKKEDVEKKVVSKAKSVSKTKSEEIIEESSNKNKVNKAVADKESKNEYLSKKRKVKEESSSDDDFESFVSNSKKKESLSVSKKQKEQIENPVLNDSDEIDVVEATPEPTKQKTKRRRKEVKSAVSKKDDEVSTQDTESTQTITQTSQESRSERITQSESTSSSERTEVISTTNESSAEQCGQKKPKTRRRRRVLKSKQFLDEDGFMVTKKEYESESYSEESDIEMMTDEKLESLPPQKKQSLILKKSLNELDKKSKANSKKQKQSSMNSFFKKK